LFKHIIKNKSKSLLNFNPTKALGKRKKNERWTSKKKKQNGYGQTRSLVGVIILASVSNGTNNKVDKSRYRFPHRLALFTKIMFIQ